MQRNPPIPNRMQYDKVREFIDDTKKAGGKFLAGAEQPAGPGYLVNPAIVTGGGGAEGRRSAGAR